MLARKVGFRYRGRFRQKYQHHLEAHDKYVYGLYKAEWRATANINPAPSHQFYRLEPVLSVRNVLETAEYYRDKLGFEIDFLYGGPPTHTGPPTHAGVSRGEWSTEGVKIQLSHHENVSEELASQLVLYIFVGPDIDSLYHQYQQVGVTVVQPLRTEPWGMQEFRIKDCNGYVLRFGTPA